MIRFKFFHHRYTQLSKSASPTATDWNSLAIVSVTSVVAASLRLLPTRGGGGGPATVSGWIPSTRDSFVILNLLAFSSAFSVAFLDKSPKAARALRILANICVCAAFLLLSCAGFSSIAFRR